MRKRGKPKAAGPLRPRARLRRRPLGPAAAPHAKRLLDLPAPAETRRAPPPDAGEPD